VFSVFMVSQWVLLDWFGHRSTRLKIPTLNVVEKFNGHVSQIGSDIVLL
jgi:hypothetical protein